jgi:membrane protein YqaA with SNARE-associated domain
MLRRLYDWTLVQAERPNAPRALAAVSFVESSFFPIPAEVLMLPMCLKHPEKSFRFALIASVFSVLGGIFGWMIGHFAYEAVAKPLLDFYGKLEAFEALRSQAGAATTTLLIMIFTSSLAHLPPIKIVNILAGAMGVNIWIFIAICTVVRSARFFFIGWMLKKYGDAVRFFIETRLTQVTIAAAALLVLSFLIFKWMT